jgi:hypothetical protein
MRINEHLNNSNGYDKGNDTNRMQQRSYISYSWSGECVFWQFCKVIKGLSNSRNKSNKSIIFLNEQNEIIFKHVFEYIKRSERFLA